MWPSAELVPELGRSLGLVLAGWTRQYGNSAAASQLKKAWNLFCTAYLQLVPPPSTLFGLA